MTPDEKQRRTDWLHAAVTLIFAARHHTNGLRGEGRGAGQSGLEGVPVGSRCAWRAEFKE